jgi:hypothetical protein
VIVCLFLAFVTAGDLKTEVSYDESYLIRRAYLDILGVVPTMEEISWYCEYNTDSYRVAVDWLVAKAHEDAKTRIWLLSKEYREKVREPLDSKQLEKNICYLSGVEYKDDPEYLRGVKHLFVNLAKKIDDSDLAAIDVICSQLMSRVTRVAEANMLLRVLREEGWDATLEKILKLEDVCNK